VDWLGAFLLNAHQTLLRYIVLNLLARVQPQHRIRKKHFGIGEALKKIFLGYFEDIDLGFDDVYETIVLLMFQMLLFIMSDRQPSAH
jgi:hypothetical protein